MKYLFIILTLLACASCQKFLDEKPVKRLSIPSTIPEYQALLDNSSRVNTSCPIIGEISADNYYIRTTEWTAMKPYDRAAYTWTREAYMPSQNDWSVTYDVVYYANLCLEGIEKIERNTQNAAAWNNIKGSALFFRSRSFLSAVWNWAKAYDATTAATDLGIPLRQSSDFNEPSVRASVQQSYDRILTDLKEAVHLLPAAPQHVMRPSKPAAYALLARTCLSMRMYDKALAYADSCLQLYNTLLDYNTVSTTPSYPFSRFNTEVIHHSTGITLHVNLSQANARMDSVLYNSYATNDLRKTLFFKANTDNTYAFRGSYDNSNANFTGVTTAEMYLVRAECYARAGKLNEAMSDVNTVLQKRFRSGTFVALTATDAADALNKILLERRKELLFRDLRWMDIKRLNKEGRNIVLIRLLNNQSYTLQPNENRYALPIPDDIIALSGMPQNPE